MYLGSFDHTTQDDVNLCKEEFVNDRVHLQLSPQTVNDNGITQVEYEQRRKGKHAREGKLALITTLRVPKQPCKVDSHTEGEVNT